VWLRRLAAELAILASASNLPPRSPYMQQQQEQQEEEGEQ